MLATFVVATNTIKQATSWLKGGSGFLLIYLRCDGFNGLVRTRELGDDRFWEAKLHGVMGEGTVLSKLLDCFNVRSGPSMILNFSTLVLEWAHDRLEENLFSFAGIGSSHRSLKGAEASHLLLNGSLRRLNLSNGLFSTKFSVDQDHDQVEGFS